MEREFIDELEEFIDAAIDENKVETIILMSCDSDGNTCILTRGTLFDQGFMLSQLRKEEGIEKIEKAAFLINQIHNFYIPDDREI